MATKQTTEESHTPGPWRVYEPIDGQTFGVDGANGDAVVFFGTDPNTSIPRIEDARLIAAAPELLTALQALVAVNGDGDSIRNLVAARAAIDKATGSAA